MLLFVGDDWAEDHHDVEIQDQEGHRLAKARLPEGVAGMARLHALVAEHAGADVDPEQVLIGIETDRGAWVQALTAAGHRVYAINPKQVARYRESHVISGAKSDAADAHTLADMVRTNAHQLRPVAGDSALVEGIKVLTRAHQSLVWERTRQVLRLRAALREYFPAALEAFEDLAAADVLELLAKAPDPDSAARLSKAQIGAALKRARRHNIKDKAAKVQAALRTEQLAQPAALTAAYAATTRSLTAVIGTLNAEVARMEGEVAAHFDQHPDVEIYRSQPGLADVLGPRVLAEFGDDPDRYADAKARKNYAGTSPFTRQSGKKKTVHARFVRNRRLIDALHQQAQSALNTSPGARAYYDHQRDRGLDHDAALRQVANRLVGILHGCLKNKTLYNEATAWSHHSTEEIPAAA